MTENTICLNCDETTLNKFCSLCGQKTNTHRITFKSLISHDIIHGVWHFEKGILFTIKEALIRPGKAALDYIAGKRIRYYNIFYLILLIVGVNIFIGSLIGNLDAQYFPNSNAVLLNNSKDKLQTFLSGNAKIMILCFIPLFAINSYLIFNKKKFNLGEHFIIAGMSFLGIMTITLVGNLFYFFNYLKNFNFLSFIADYLTPLSILVYLFYSYYSAFSNSYGKKENLLRVLLFVFILMLEIVGLLLLAMKGFKYI